MSTVTSAGLEKSALEPMPSTKPANVSVVLPPAWAGQDLGVRLAALAGADFVKTSTGFAGGGATIRDVRAMAEMARIVGAY